MSEHHATITWEKGSEPFTYQTYTRDHVWSFKDGQKFEASAAASFLGNPALVDPEDAMVASLSSCHMLTLLAVATKKKYVIEDYTDKAVGFLEKNDDGKLALTRVILRPRITFSGDQQPDEAALAQLHDIAHRECFIANSVKTEVTVEAP
ncbi:MAG: OsmC family protein [Verrucomicrobiota bacterium]